MKALMLAVLVVSLAVAPAEARSLRTLEAHYETKGVRTVRFEAAPGDVRVEPSPDGRVHVLLDVRCENDSWDDCAGRAEKIRLTGGTEGSLLRVEVLGMRNQDSRGLSVNARIQVPAERPFELHTLAGDIDVKGLKNDIDLDVIAGEVKVTMDERDFGSLRANVAVGGATLWTDAGRVAGDGWLGQRLVWSRGKGEARVNVGLKVGEVDVRVR